MILHSSLESMRHASADWRARGLRIGLVPTMGCLHAGHFSLMQKAREHADIVVVSLFVNPLQFGPNEDFQDYPRTREQDVAHCRAQGVDAVFAPGPETLYAKDHSVYVTENALSRTLCGAARPGHFRGVATVVLKLFHIVAPHVAVFGQKDAQQARIVARMTRDLNCPVEMAIAPIVREADGLAMSSRNRRLTEAQRRQATRLWSALQAARSAYELQQIRPSAVLKQILHAVLEEGAGGLEVEYAEVVDYETLQPVAMAGPGVLVAVAARIGSVRLIDNFLIE